MAEKAAEFIKNEAGKSLSRWLILSFSIVIVYTIVAIVFQAVTPGHPELSPTLTDGVYKFFGLEIAAAAFIKIFKIKEGDSYNE